MMRAICRKLCRPLSFVNRALGLDEELGMVEYIGDVLKLDGVTQA